MPLDYRFFPQIHQEICQDCSPKNNLLRVEEALMEIYRAQVPLKIPSKAGAFKDIKNLNKLLECAIEGIHLQYFQRHLLCDIFNGN